MLPKKIKRIGILTGGGDCPGLNAVIRAVTKTAQNNHGIEVMGIFDSYLGLVTENMQLLTNMDVSGILNRGGTILGTSRVNAFAEAHKLGKIPSPKEDWNVVKRIMKRNKIDALVAIGGDGTQRVATRVAKAGIPIIGVPKTIDNDIAETDVTFGFNSAVNVIMEALDRLHTTAMSHHRVMVVEVMGRTVGWLGLEAGVAGGGDVILIPEIPYKEEFVFNRVLERSRTGKRFSLVVISEGAKAKGKQKIFSGNTDASGRKILGGVGEILADRIEEATGLSTRLTKLGHLQRGGSPTAYDRVLATRFGHEAMELLAAGLHGNMVALKGNRIVPVPLEKATVKTKKVPHNHMLIRAARAVGTSFGDM